MQECGGLYYFKKLRRTDWLPIGGGDSDEESERGSASDAESVDAYGDVCSEASDCSTLRSEGYMSSDGSVSEHEFDDEGNPIGKNTPIVGEPEPQEAYADIFRALKRQKTAE